VSILGREDQVAVAYLNLILASESNPTCIVGITDTQKLNLLVSEEYEAEKRTLEGSDASNSMK